MSAQSVIAIVDDIWTRRLSRNKNFSLFRRSEYARALKLKKYLERLGGSMLAFNVQGDLELYLEKIGPDRIALHLVVESIQVRRTCYLKPEELELLCRHLPEVGELINSASASTSPEVRTALGRS